jgi:uncharacterized Tic20 family protein
MTSPSQPTSEQQTWRVLAHASAFVQLLGIPSVVGPLVIWLVRRDDPMVEPHARAALNFQLSLFIYFLVGGVVAVIALVTIIGIGLAFLIGVVLFVLFILELVFALMATLAASRGELYVYPMSLQLIKG